MNRINQHHVWRYYLEAWAEGGTFACCRNGNVFGCQPKSVATQRYFYRIEELVGSDFAFIERIFLAQMSPYLQQLSRSWLHMINAPFKHIERLREQGVDEEKLGLVRKELENNILEEIHGHVEASGKQYLVQLRAHDTSFFLNKDAKVDFLLFLTTQYFRTTKIKANMLDSAGRAIKEQLGYDMEKIWNPVSYVFATSTSYSISGDESFGLVLLNNKTATSFLTGDQPVLNTRATYISRNEQVREIELYYPISPIVAILVTNDKVRYPKSIIEVDEESVNSFNDHIAKNSLNDIYASSKQQLESKT